MTENNCEKNQEFIELGKRIDEAIQKTGKNKSVFASDLGVDPPQISRWVKGENAPSYEYLVKIGELSNVSLDWLLTGEERIEKRIFRVEKPAIPCEIDEEFITVPQVRGKISIGKGLVPDNTIEMRIAFRKDWIQRKGLPQNMSLIRVSGDSMEPTLESGDIVLIDNSRNYVDPNGGIYAIVFDDDIMLKRLQILYPSNKIKIISDNPIYEPLVVDQEALIINGKAIWFSRELERQII